MFKVIKSNIINTNLDYNSNNKYEIQKYKLGIVSNEKNNIFVGGNFMKKNNLINYDFNNKNINLKLIDKNLRLTSIKYLNKNTILGLINNDNCEYKLVKINLATSEFIFFDVNYNNDFYKNIYRTVRDNCDFKDKFDKSKLILKSFILIGCDIHFFVQYKKEKDNGIFIISSQINLSNNTIENCFKLNTVYNVTKIASEDTKKAKKLILEDVVINPQLDELILLLQYDGRSYLYSLKYFKEMKYFGSTFYNILISEYNQTTKYLDDEFKGITYLDCNNIILCGFFENLDINSNSCDCNDCCKKNDPIKLFYKKLKK